MRSSDCPAQFFLNFATSAALLTFYDCLLQSDSESAVAGASLVTPTSNMAANGAAALNGAMANGHTAQEGSFDANLYSRMLLVLFSSLPAAFYTVLIFKVTRLVTLQ